jgi:CO dehydrogenase maturation factor
VKIAISGKGGVGKTTLSAMLAATLSLRGHSVVALDADPDANLAAALGVPIDEQPTPLCQMHDLIAERTGAKEQYGGYFKLNPKVDDIPEKYARRIGNIHLLVLGGVQQGGSGCLCPASALLKALLVHLVLGRDENLVMDMEAGIEHLGRATAQSMDALITVVDPGPWSIQTALRVRDLAADLGIKKIFAVANRFSPGPDAGGTQNRLAEIPLIGHLPTDDRLNEGIMGITDDGQIEPSEALTENAASVEEILSEVESRI